jgi:hypothetical protein
LLESLLPYLGDVFLHPAPPRFLAR